MEWDINLKKETRRTDVLISGYLLKYAYADEYYYAGFQNGYLVKVNRNKNYDVPWRLKVH